MAYATPAGGPPLAVANFGLLMNDGRPEGWQFVCDDVYGTPLPELVRVDARGRIFAAAASGLRRSDDGCAWTAAGGELAGLAVVDVAFEPEAPDRVWALAGPEAGRVLARSADGGATFQVVHRFSGGHPYSRLLLAPSDGRRVIVSGGTGGSTWLAVSEDGGASFSVRDLAAGMDPPPPNPFALLAVSPADPQVLFFGLLDAYGDEIWRSEDGGRSLQRVLKGGARDWMTALAFGSNGQTVYAGAAVVPVLDQEPPGRLYVSRDSGRSFGAAIPTGPDGPAFRCLQVTGDKLYACSGEDPLGQTFLVGVSADEGRSWTPLLRLRDLGGARSCVRALCAASEAWLCDRYGRCPEAPAADAGATDGAADAPVGAIDRDAAADAGDACASGRCGTGGGGCHCELGARSSGASGGGVRVFGVFLVVVTAVRLRAGRRS